MMIDPRKVFKSEEEIMLRKRYSNITSFEYQDTRSYKIVFKIAEMDFFVKPSITMEIVNDPDIKHSELVLHECEKAIDHAYENPVDDLTREVWLRVEYMKKHPEATLSITEDGPTLNSDDEVLFRIVRSGIKL